jgi:hypothetical protein
MISTNGLARSRRSAWRAAWSRFCSRAWASIPNRSSISATMRVAATSLGLSLAASKNFLRACASARFDMI